jgi:hypothetical protein
MYQFLFQSILTVVLLFINPVSSNPIRSNPRDSDPAHICCSTMVEKSAQETAAEGFPGQFNSVKLHKSAHLSQMITQSFCANENESLANHPMPMCRSGKCVQHSRYQAVLVNSGSESDSGVRISNIFIAAGCSFVPV